MDSGLREWRPLREASAGFSEHSKGRGTERIRGHFGKERRKLRRKNYQMGRYWCCSVRCVSKAGGTGLSHLCMSGRLGGGWKGASILPMQNLGNKSSSGHGTWEITHRDRGIRERAAWIQERKEDWSVPAVGWKKLELRG